MNVYTKKPLGSTQGKQKFIWQRIVGGITVLILLIVLLNIFQTPIKNTFYIVTSPISKVFWRAGDSTSGFFESYVSVSGLKQENTNLNLENQNLLAQIASLQQAIKSDQAKQNVIENTQQDNFTLASAQVLGQDSTSDFILINQGSDDGISENMPVISSSKVLYGKTFKVYKNFSQVMLISNESSVVDAKIQQSDLFLPPVLGVIKGSGNLSLYLDLISSDAKLQVQDTLVTSGQEGIFPKNLLIGKVQNSDKNDLKPFQTAQVLPFFDVKTIENVFVITNYLHEKIESSK